MNIAVLPIRPRPRRRSPIRSIISPTSCSTRMGSDGVYARTALYEGVVEKLAALITQPSRGRHRGDALPAGDEPRPAGEVRLSQELPEPARLRLRPARHRARDQRRGEPLRCRRRLDHVAVAGRPRAVAGRLLSGLSDRGEPRPAAGGRPALRRRRRLLPPRAVASISTACNRSGCANTSASARPTTSPISASAGWSARRRSRPISA